MRLLRFVPLIALLAVVAVAAGCGGGGKQSVPSDAVATVGNTDITKAQFALLDGRHEARLSRAQDGVPEGGDGAVQGAAGSDDEVPRPAVGARAEGEGPRHHRHRQGRSGAHRADQEAVLRWQSDEVPRAAQGAGPDGGAARAQPPGPDPLGEDLREGDGRHEGLGRGHRQRTTPRTSRRTRRPRAATCATSS